MPSDRRDIHNSDIPVVCVSCEARHRGICGALSPDQLSELAKHTRRRTYDHQIEVMASHEQVTTYANIIRGLVKLEKLMEDGRQQIVGLKFAPDFLGRPYKDEADVSSVVTAGSELCLFPKAILDKIVEDTPAMRDILHAQALKELDEARDWMLALGRKTAPEKVAAFLHFMSQHSDPEKVTSDDTAEFDLTLTRAEIADFLGLTIETVSRQFTNLRKAGLIEIKNRTHISIPSLNALRVAGGS